MPDHNDLTTAQQQAINAWWDEQNAVGEEFEFVDNTRYARRSNQAEEMAYEEARAAGCCGSVDVELTCADGSILMFGFNYGH